MNLPRASGALRSISARARAAFALALALALALAIPGAAFAQAAVPAPAPAPAPAGFYADATEAVRAKVAEADALGSEGKWLSAWNLLAAVDPDNKDGFVLAAKTRIALDGNAQTAMHIVFAFADLPAGMDLASVREAGIEGLEPVEFDPWGAAQALETAGAALPPVLSLALGDYFSEVLALYPGQWLQEEGVVAGWAIEQYDRAYAYEVYTKTSIVKHADLLAKSGKADAAEALLARAMELDPSDASLPLRLVDAYAAQGRTEEALARLEPILANASDPTARYDLLIKGIQVGLQDATGAMAEPYLVALEKDYAEDFLAPLVRHMVAVRSGDGEKAGAIADATLDKYPTQSEVISSMLGTWISAQDAPSGFAFLERGVARFAGKPDALGPLHFYTALMFAETAQGAADLEKALAELGKAETYFKEIFPADHGVFGTIEKLREQFSAKPEEQIAAPVAPVAPAAAPAPAAPAAEPAADAESGASEATEEYAAPAAPAAATESTGSK